MPEPQYHLAELEIALDPTRPEHVMPELSSSRIGVVDVGCGIGQLFVAKGDEIQAGVSRYGFDIDASAIAYANARWPDKARFAVAPAERLPLPDSSVDRYVSRVSLPYTDIRMALREAARVLVPGGRLWITLHPVSMAFGQLAKAVRGARVKEFITGSIFLANGLAFHILGTGRRILGIRESWQSETRMRRELQRDFTDVRVSSNGRYFLVEATRR